MLLLYLDTYDYTLFYDFSMIFLGIAARKKNRAIMNVMLSLTGIVWREEGILHKYFKWVVFCYIHCFLNY